MNVLQPVRVLVNAITWHRAPQHIYIYIYIVREVINLARNSSRSCSFRLVFVLGLVGMNLSSHRIVALTYNGNDDDDGEMERRPRRVGRVHRNGFILAKKHQRITKHLKKRITQRHTSYSCMDHG